jgi:acetate kinase
VAQPDAVGHRVVHGGSRTAPALVDDAVLAELRGLVPLAPLHMPASPAGIDAVRARFPGLPQVACFDTAFHAGLPERARRLPVPADLDARGVRRYGFHGLSYEHVLGTLEAPPARIILAHLGAGASLVALADGRPVDTTMGFTPCGGLLMGTRPGDVDPGVLVYLMRARGLDADGLEDFVNHRSGLYALAGSADVRELCARAGHDRAAALALDLFATSVRKAIGAFAAVLGGLDLLVFTGGIGEHAPSIRWDACQGLQFLGLELDPARNDRGDPIISAAGSRCTVRVTAADEEEVIARHTASLVSP